MPASQNSALAYDLSAYEQSGEESRQLTRSQLRVLQPVDLRIRSSVLRSSHLRARSCSTAER